jgi:hypothetical protein
MAREIPRGGAECNLNMGGAHHDPKKRATYGRGKAAL